jgi:hypothetical protein
MIDALLYHLCKFFRRKTPSGFIRICIRMRGTYLCQHLVPHDQNNRKEMYRRARHISYVIKKKSYIALFTFSPLACLLTCIYQKSRILVSLRLRRVPYYHFCNSLAYVGALELYATRIHTLHWFRS